jgi:hypothetical protein
LDARSPEIVFTHKEETMARIICHYLDCAFLDEGYCSAGMVEIDPDSGCITFKPTTETVAEDDWSEEEDEEVESWEGLEDGEEDDEDDIWQDNDEEDS